METLSATGLSIKDLDNVSIVADNDLLILEDVSEGDNGLTGNVTVSQLATKVASSIFDATLNFENTNNTFSGSFYGTQTTIPANFYNIISRNNLTVNNNLTVANNSSITGTLSVTNTSTFANNLTISSGNLAISTGTLTVSSGNSILQALACSSIANSGTLSATTITGTVITATTRFIGEITGAVKGDIYSPTGIKVLENGTGDADQALFYGSSSYATTSSYVTDNGVPVGGTTGQVLSKNSGNDYDYTWGNFSGASISNINTIVTSSITGTANYFGIFEVGPNKIKTGPMYFYNSQNIFTNSGIGLRVENANIQITNGNIIADEITGSNILLNSGGVFSASNGAIYINDVGTNMSYIPNLTVNNVTNSHITSSDSGTTTQIHASLYSNKFFELELSQSCNVTMSLNNGQIGYILVKQESVESNTITWYYSTDEGNTVQVGTSILWENGSEPSLTVGGIELIEFLNFGNIIYGKYTANYS